MSHMMLIFSSYVLLVLFSTVQSTVKTTVKGTRTFVEGYGIDVPIKQGDTIVRSMHSRKIVTPPYHWLYAVSDQKLIGFWTLSGVLKNLVVPEYINKSDLDNVKIINRGQKAGNVGKAGALVVSFMVGKQLYFNVIDCNCKHYVEYVSRGLVTDDSCKKVTYLKMGKNCPLYHTFNSEDYTSIKAQGTFDLIDGHGDKVVISGFEE